jgi:archaeal flagellar protein FlaJ
MASIDINQVREKFSEIREEIRKQKYLVRELNYLVSNYRGRGGEQRTSISNKIYNLKRRMSSENRVLYNKVAVLNLVRPLSKKLPTSSNARGEYSEIGTPWHEAKKAEKFPKKIKVRDKNLIKEEEKLKKVILKRLKKDRKKKKIKKERKPNPFVVLSNKMFFKRSAELSKGKMFQGPKKDLIKAGMDVLPSSYISLILFVTMLSFIFSIFLYVFLLFFKLSVTLPFISFATSGILSRLLINLWIPIVIPTLSFIFMYSYPSLEKKSVGGKINQELPFVVIHMSAIAGSMIEPSKMFSVIIATGEYKQTRKEFIRLINQVNVYGYDLVTALRDAADKSPSSKLAELYRGLATTIVSGGDMTDFLDKRAKTLLFDYRLEREKYTKMTESFMDIYISVVIAAPMIFMLVLIMIQISNIGLGLSPQAITVLIIGIVTAINIFFLVFLQLKQPES